VSPEDRKKYQQRTSPEREMRGYTLYRLYRRHLQSRMGSNEWRLFRDFERRYGERWDRPVRMRTAHASQESLTRAYAQVLFQYTLEGPIGISLEGPDTVFGPEHNRAPISLLEGIQCADGLFHAASMLPRASDHFRCSPAEGLWIEDHLVFEGFRSLFEDCICRAREMARTGYYFLAHLGSFQKYYFPATQLSPVKSCKSQSDH